MSYTTRSSQPDWEATALTLREVLEDIIFQLEESHATGVRTDVMVLDAFDMLDRYISAVKSDLGI